jgi:hypothetical protein
MVACTVPITVIEHGTIRCHVVEYTDKKQINKKETRR